MIRAIAAVVLLCVGPTAALAQAAPSASSPVCVYQSKSYSDGALLCAYRTLMLTCSVDGAKASWKPGTDEKLASACEASSARPRVVEAPPRPRHRLRHPARVNADRSPKCFVFNSKQYCE